MFPKSRRGITRFLSKFYLFESCCLILIVKRARRDDADSCAPRPRIPRAARRREGRAESDGEIADHEIMIRNAAEAPCRPRGNHRGAALHRREAARRDPVELGPHQPRERA